MLNEHTFEARVEWQGNRGSGTTGFRDYGRELVVTGEAKHPIEASAAKVFHGNKDRWNPEELLIAALAQCHMLSYLHMAVRAGVVVTAYSDTAVGRLAQEGLGGQFTEVVLHPRVTIAESSSLDAAIAAHAAAHEHCFIANSVAFPIRIEPIVEAAA